MQHPGALLLLSRVERALHAVQVAAIPVACAKDGLRVPQGQTRLLRAASANDAVGECSRRLVRVHRHVLVDAAALFFLQFGLLGPHLVRCHPGWFIEDTRAHDLLRLAVRCKFIRRQCL